MAGYRPATVLDAGCGTGRVAIELHRRGLDVVGVDLDRSMLETACEKAPDVEWFRADLSTLRLTSDRGRARRFHVVLCAGNVLIFLEPGTEAATVERLAEHLVPGGLLISGFQLTANRYQLEAYDADCAAAGLQLFERFSTWSRDRWDGHGGYAVSVHRRPQSKDGQYPTDDVAASAAASDGAEVATPTG